MNASGIVAALAQPSRRSPIGKTYCCSSKEIAAWHEERNPKAAVVVAAATGARGSGQELQTQYRMHSSHYSPSLLPSCWMIPEHCVHKAKMGSMSQKKRNVVLHFPLHSSVQTPPNKKFNAALGRLPRPGMKKNISCPPELDTTMRPRVSTRSKVHV